MPILKLTPTCKDYLWGGSRLRTDFGITVTVLSPLFKASGSRVAVCAVLGGAAASAAKAGSAAPGFVSAIPPASSNKPCFILCLFFIHVSPFYPKEKGAVAQGKNPSAAAPLRLHVSKSTKTLALDPVIFQKEITQTGHSE